MENNTKTKDNINQLKDIFRGFLPENKTEIWILLVAILSYTSYSIILAVNTSIIDNKEYLYDVYFSFDNPIIYIRGYVYLDGHPLMKYITIPFIYIGDRITYILGDKSKTLFITFICTLLVSSSLMYTYRYLTKVICINRKIVVLILVFMQGVMATNMILSFTPESFTITLFLLSYTIYFYSYYIKINKPVRLASSTLLSVLLGGITITNFTKGIIPILFLHEKWRSKLRKIILPSIIIILVMLWLQTKFDIIEAIRDRIQGELQIEARGNYFERAFEWFYASPILFPNIIFMNGDAYNLHFGNAIVLDFFSHWWQYAFAVILLVIIISSFKVNYKNKLVQIIFLFLLQDIIIHIVIGYGLRDPFIYGGHWVFLVPLLLGWLYQGIKNYNTKKVYILVLITMLLVLIINNGIQLCNFINLAIENFPAYTSLS